VIKINNNKIKILNQKKIKRKRKKRTMETTVKREVMMALSFQLGFQEKLPMSKANKIRTRIKMPPAKMIKNWNRS